MYEPPQPASHLIHFLTQPPTLQIHLTTIHLLLFRDNQTATHLHHLSNSYSSTSTSRDSYPLLYSTSDNHLSIPASEPAKLPPTSSSTTTTTHPSPPPPSQPATLHLLHLTSSTRDDDSSAVVLTEEMEALWRV